MAELKPCPFCGGRARVIQSDPLEKGKKEFYVFGVYCTDRGGLMRKCAEKDAVEAWNRRAEK